MPVITSWCRAGIVGAVALAVAGLAACGGDDDSSGTPAESTSISVRPPLTTPVAPPTPAPETAPTTLPATTSPAAVPATSPAPSAATVPDTTPASTPAGDARPPSVAQLLASGRVLNLAHAGGDQDHPHSTMYAYRESVAAGADVLELDVQLTGDGVLIVQHDDTTAKTTEIDLPVGSSDLATLQALDNAYWWSPECWPCHDLADDAYPFRGVRTGDVAPPPGYTADDFRIVTLAELAAAFPAMPFDIEIKGEGEAGAAVAEALAAELVELDRVDSTVVASFDSTVIQYFHSLAPDVAVSPGVNEMAAWLLAGAELAPEYRIIQVPPFYDGLEVLTPENLAVAEAAGVTVWVWPNDAATQENEAFYAELIAAGIDGIIAGRPAQATSAITTAFSSSGSGD